MNLGNIVIVEEMFCGAVMCEHVNDFGHTFRYIIAETPEGKYEIGSYILDRAGDVFHTDHLELHYLESVLKFVTSDGERSLCFMS